eukprot:jgi/Tetstr1/423429/TSEL_014110.t1
MAWLANGGGEVCVVGAVVRVPRDVEVQVAVNVREDSQCQMMCVVGDDCEVALMEVGSGKQVASLSGK